MPEESISKIDHEQFYTLLLSIKNAVDVMQYEVDKKDSAVVVFNEALDKVYSCLNAIKLDLQKFKTEQTGFIEARKDRSNNCDMIHADHEKRLRDHPPELRCAHEKRLTSLEKKVDVCIMVERIETAEGKINQVMPTLYKVIGGVVVIAIIVPPMISGVITFIVKKLAE